MKKSHWILLIITIVLSSFSAYSLAAINQTHKIDYEWYSFDNEKFINGERRIKNDPKWGFGSSVDEIFCTLSNSVNDLGDKENEKIQELTDNNGSNEFIYLLCAKHKESDFMGKIEVIDIAERGSLVEIMLNIEEIDNRSSTDENLEYEYIYTEEVVNPIDVVRINKKHFNSDGKRCFVFKNQYGRQICMIYAKMYT